MAATGDLNAVLIPEAAAVAASLDSVRRSCIDYCPPIPHLDQDLLGLSYDIDGLVAWFLEVAVRFLAADRRDLWRLLSNPMGLLHRLASGRGGPHGPPPPLVTLMLMGRRTTAGDDLRDIGHALLGPRRWLRDHAKPVVDDVSVVAGWLQLAWSRPWPRSLAERLAETPIGRRALGSLGLVSHTPVLQVAGGTMAALTILEDGNRLRRDGNPLGALRQKGAGYVADVAGTAFDVSSNTCEIAPSPFSCGSAVISGSVWAGAEIWKHRKGLGHLADSFSDGTGAAADFAVDEARRFRNWVSHVPGSVGHLYDDFSHGNPGVWQPPRWLIPPGREIGDRVRGLEKPVLDQLHLVEDALDNGARSARGAWHTGTDAVSDGFHSLSNLVKTKLPDIKLAG